jgi:hypothetical protein
VRRAPAAAASTTPPASPASNASPAQLRHRVDSSCATSRHTARIDPGYAPPTAPPRVLAPPLRGEGGTTPRPRLPSPPGRVAACARAARGFGPIPPGPSSGPAAGAVSAVPVRSIRPSRTGRREVLQAPGRQPATGSTAKAGVPGPRRGSRRGPGRTQPPPEHSTPRQRQRRCCSCTAGPQHWLSHRGYVRTTASHWPAWLAGAAETARLDGHPAGPIIRLYPGRVISWEMSSPGIRPGSLLRGGAEVPVLG